MNQLYKTLTTTIFCLSIVACSSKDTIPGSPNNPAHQSATETELSKRDATKRIFSIYEDSPFTLKLTPTANCLNTDLLKPYQQNSPNFSLQAEESARDLEFEERYSAEYDRDHLDLESSISYLEEMRPNKININTVIHIFDSVHISFTQETKKKVDRRSTYDFEDEDKGKIWYTFSNIESSDIGNVSLVDQVIDEEYNGKIWLKFKLSNIPGLMNSDHPENSCEEIYIEISN